MRGGSRDRYGRTWPWAGTGHRRSLGILDDGPVGDDPMSETGYYAEAAEAMMAAARRVRALTVESVDDELPPIDWRNPEPIGWPPSWSGRPA
jgi:hypothetical protein